MQKDQRSRTAEYMAFFRALETARRRGRRIVADPYAALFLSPGLHRAVNLSRIPGVRPLIERYADRRAGGARTSAVARTRFIDEAWLHAIDDGVRQIVILGAGFDCRAYRLRNSASTIIYEVDLRTMLAFKRSKLGQNGGALQANVRFVEIDFDRDNLPMVLADAGFDSTAPALFIWEGVTNYLSADAVDSVLRFVGRCAPGSRIVFTYVHQGALDGSVEFDGAARIRSDVAGLGEPWTFGLDPTAVPVYLRERNLQLDCDAGAAEYRLRFYGPGAKRMQGYDFYHVAAAHVCA